MAHILKKIALALFYILIYIILLFVITMHVEFLEEDIENYSGIVTILASFAAILIYAVIFYFRDVKVYDYITFKKLQFLEITLSFMMAMGFRLLTASYLMWSEMNVPLIRESIKNAQQGYNFNTMTTFCVVSVILSVCLVGPIFEEILFRGIVLKELEGAMPTPWAIVIQAILFGIAHVVLAQSIFAVVYGLILGVIYCRTKNILIVIISHIFFNLSSVLEIKNTDMLGRMVVTGLILTLVSIFIFFYIYKSEKPARTGLVTGGKDNV